MESLIVCSTLAVLELIVEYNLIPALMIISFMMFGQDMIGLCLRLPKEGLNI